jgi:hypothetical protein
MTLFPLDLKQHPPSTRKDGTPVPEPPKTANRPVTQFLMEQRRGALHEEFSDLLAETVAAVTEHGKVGAVTLKLQIKPAGDGMVQIFDGLSAKAPEGSKEPSLFYVTESGSVSRSNPRQDELPLRNVREVAS